MKVYQILFKESNGTEYPIGKIYSSEKVAKKHLLVMMENSYGTFLDKFEKTPKGFKSKFFNTAFKIVSSKLVEE